jgi:hypothetical protein
MVRLLTSANTGSADTSCTVWVTKLPFDTRLTDVGWPLARKLTVELAMPSKSRLATSKGLPSVIVTFSAEIPPKPSKSKSKELSDEVSSDKAWRLGSCVTVLS